MKLVYVILSLMVVSSIQAAPGKIGLCTKDYETKVAALYTEIYSAVSEKQK